MINNQFEIGKIVNTQGIKGEVRALPHTDNINRFKKLKSVYVCTKKENKLMDIEKVRFHKQFVVIKFKDINDMNEAEKLKECMLKVDEEDAIKLEEDEYFIRDLYGINVFDEEHIAIGVLKDIIFTGANDVYVIETEDGEFLLPAIKQCIIDINIKENKMIVHILEGLL